MFLPVVTPNEICQSESATEAFATTRDLSTSVKIFYKCNTGETGVRLGRSAGFVQPCKWIDSSRTKATQDVTALAAALTGSEQNSEVQSEQVDAGASSNKTFGGVRPMK